MAELGKEVGMVKQQTIWTVDRAKEMQNRETMGVDDYDVDDE